MIKLHARLTSKHDEEAVIEVNVAQFKSKGRPISTYLFDQVKTINETASDFLAAQHKTEETYVNYSADLQNIFKELLASQAIFIPFDVRVIKLVLIYMDHVANGYTPNQRRAAKMLPKPLPGNRKFETIIPPWHNNFLT